MEKKEEKMTFTKLQKGLAAALLLTTAGATAVYAAPGKNARMMTIDSNGDGEISKAESTAGAEAMFAKMDKNRDGQLSEADRIAAQKEKFAEMDGDKNGSVTEAEFLAAAEARKKEREERRAERGAMGDGPQADDEDGMRGKRGKGMGGKGMGGKGMHGKGMELADTNGDKIVTKAEFMAAAAARFAEADSDGNGVISKEERREEMQERRAERKGDGQGKGDGMRGKRRGPPPPPAG
ncbi:calcium-binding protein [Sphingorhabdus lutea]|nr:calcium-binding protein [Sphingorhabdus lutea]